MVWGAREMFQKKERHFRRLQRETTTFFAVHICRFVQPCCKLLLQAAWQHKKLPSLWQFPLLTHFPSLTQSHQWSQTSRRASPLQHFGGQGYECPPSGERMGVWGLPHGGEWRVDNPVIALDPGQWRLRSCRLLGFSSGLFCRALLLLCKMKRWHQWVPRWINYSRTHTLHFSLFNTPNTDIPSNMIYSYSFSPSSIHYRQTNKIHVYTFDYKGPQHQLYITGAFRVYSSILKKRQKTSDGWHHAPLWEVP